MVVLVVASVLGGMTEAGILALVVAIAATMSGGESAAAIDLGPVDLSGTSLDTLLWVAGALVLARLLLHLVAGYLPARIAADMQARLRSRIFRAYRRAGWHLQSKEKEGHLQQVLSGEVGRATQSVLTLTAGLAAVTNFVTLVAASIVLNPVAAALVIGVAVVLFFLLRPMSQRARRASQAFARANLAFSHGIAESVRMAEETQTFGVGGVEEERVDGLIQGLREPFFRTRLLGRILSPIYQTATLSLIVGGLAALYATGADNLASLGAVVLLLVRALSYSQTLQSTYHTFSEQMPYIELVQQSMAKYVEAAVDDGSEELRSIDDVAFRDVSYSYVPDEVVLRDVSFMIHKGEALGVVGPSGAGKSTLVQLLLRLRVPDSGVMEVNGQPAEVYRRDDWYRRVAYLPQDARLISGTVAENIRYHRDWIDDAAIEQAARLAGIHDEVTRWKQGYGTLIGQRADAISGGQRQRVCLARTLAGGPDLLVLDEPTSALDMDSERLVQESLRSRRPGVTVVVIAHRMSTLTDCDRILVLEDGQAAAIGTPDEVRASNVFFRRSSSQGLASGA